ncbi:MAG: hypothetical protein JWQ66_3273 [Mucilaginibacter sp.]|nr:hypothetical protein [Mucilaginibacter sp.]
MEKKNLFIPSGVTFGVTEIPKEENENQKFQIDLNDNFPERVIEYTPYDTWNQVNGKLMLDNHIEMLGRAIKINFKELF